MYIKQLVASAAVLALTACSGTSGPFDGKAPEEVAMFILSGIEKDKIANIPASKVILKTIPKSEKPLTIDLEFTAEGKTFIARTFTVSDLGSCKFRYQLDDRSPRYPSSIVLEANLLELASGAHKNSEQATFSGAKLQCVGSSGAPCDKIQVDLNKGELPRLGAVMSVPGNLKDMNDKEIGEAMNERLSDAIQHLKSNICKA